MNQETTKELYHFLSPKDNLAKADLIIGFGHFDLRIPEQCAALFENGLAPKILFTGGIGAGSADFKNAEAVEFLNHLKNKYSEINMEDVLIESTSTNTGDNLKFSIEILKAKGLFESLKRIILVATPTRQLRVFLTAKKYFPKVELINLPPSSSFEIDKQLNEVKAIDFEEHLLGELDRIQKYPKMGFACSTEIPIAFESLM